MSCNEWKNVKLGEVADILSGYAFKTKDFVDEGIPVIKIKNIVPPIIDINDVQYVSDDLYIEKEKYALKYNDILISMTGSNINQIASAVGKIGRVKINDTRLLLNQRVGKLYITETEKCNYDYLYYFLIQPKVRYNLAASAGGSANQANINPSQIKDINLLLPSLEEQKRIASILISLDNKVELNNKMNKTLEEMAQVLFKRWFVDFEFPNEAGGPYKSNGGEMVESELGMIPKGWSVGCLADLVNIKYGKDHKKLEDGKIPVYGSGGVMRYVNKSLYEKESVLIPRKGTLNNVMYVNEPFWSVDTMFFTEMKLPNVAKFVFQFVKSKDLAMMNIGSAVPSMTTAILNSMGIVIPCKNKLEKFDEVITSFYKQIEFNNNNSNKLIKLRDSLLPKLMSGEIAVEDIEANL